MEPSSILIGVLLGLLAGAFGHAWWSRTKAGAEQAGLRDHMEIAERAGALYDKFLGFTEDLINVGQQMDTAKRSYSEAMSKLSEGRGNLVRQVEMLKQLGAKTNKSVNPNLLTRALEGTEEPAS